MAESFDNWCLVELFGHSRIVGRVTEATIGGCSFIRVDVPAHNKMPEFTRYLGNGAIYSLNPMSEEAALIMLDQIALDSPVAWTITDALKTKARELVAHDDDDDDDDIGF